MGKIKNSSLNNVFGEGKEQIFTSGGKKYVIKNSSLDNVFGDGKEKIVEEAGSSDLIDLPWWVVVMIVIGCIIIQRALA